MIRTFTSTYKFAFAKRANTFIYFIKKIPILGKKIPENLYGETNIKMILGIIFEILSFLFGFIRKAIYIGVMVLIPAMYFSKDIGNTKDIAVQIFFFLSFILGPLEDTVVLSDVLKSFNMIRLMRVDSRKYFIGQIVYKRILDFIYFIPIMVIVFSPLEGMILSIEFIAIRFIGELVHLFIYNKLKVLLPSNAMYNVIIIVLGMVLAYLLPFLKINISIGNWLYDYRVLALLIILSGISLKYIFKYKKFKEIDKIICTKAMAFNGQNIMAEATFADVKIDEKKMKSEELNSNIYESKKGYEYLNAIFFRRHRKLLSRATRNIVIAIIIISLAIIGFVLWKPEAGEDVIKGLYKTAPLWIFIMYSICTSQKICKAMFYNCDVSLLRYGYYREGNVIIANFRARLKRIIIFNVIPALAICMGIIGIILSIGRFSMMLEMIPMFLSIICLSCFFSIHHLVLYYVIQPYTAALKVKSPLFSIINSLMYIGCYMCLNLDITSYLFSIGIIIFTVIYMIIALIVVYKVAPKTFKLR